MVRHLQGRSWRFAPSGMLSSLWDVWCPWEAAWAPLQQHQIQGILVHPGAPIPSLAQGLSSPVAASSSRWIWDYGAMLGMDGRESLLGWPRSLLSLAHPGGKTRRRFLNREFSHIYVVGRGFGKLTGSEAAAPSHPKIPVPTAGWKVAHSMENSFASE